MLHLSLSPPPPHLSMDPTLLLLPSRPHAPPWRKRRRTPRTLPAIPTTDFLGERLRLVDRTSRGGGFLSLSLSLSLSNPRAPSIITSAIKRRKERPFDDVIERDKKLKLVLKIRRILVNQPDRVMNLRDLGKYRRNLGLTRKRRFIALLRRFPGVFDVLEEGAYALKFRLTPEAERLYLEELRLRNDLEDLHITKLRKLLMMSIHKRIPLEKIAHLKSDLGLPLEFRDTICRRYPQYFEVVPTDRGPALELTHWDPHLAVSAHELLRKNESEDGESGLIVDRPRKFRRVKLPRGLKLPRKDMARMAKFEDMPYVSPYSDFSDLKSGTPEKEKHACGVVHEILSLTVEKRTLVDHLTHFREEFRFSQQLRGMLIRHPDIFYVSLKGDRDSVFLREAYRDSQLVDKDRLLVLKEKMRALVSIPRFGRRHAEGATDEAGSGEEDEEEEEEWSDVDDFGGDEEDGDWSDEDDDIPPDFDDDDDDDDDGGDDGVAFKGGGPVRERVRVESSSSNVQEKDRVPVLPDGRPRERW